jgi:hypothetical protein
MSEMFLNLKAMANPMVFPVVTTMDHVFQSLEIIMTFMGACHGFPAAIPALVSMQANAVISTHGFIQHYFECSILEEFFKSSRFASPFPDDYPITHVRQAFLLTLVDCLSLRIESCSGQDLLQLLQWVAFCRRERLHKEHHEFIDWYREEGSKRNIHRLVTFLLVNHIAVAAENVIKKQSNLENALHHLIKQGHVHEKWSEAYPVNVLVPGAHAGNLMALKEFYLSLDDARQKMMADELLFTVIVQPGQMSVEGMGFNRPDKWVSEQLSRPSSRFLNFSSSRRASATSVKQTGDVRFFDSPKLLSPSSSAISITGSTDIQVFSITTQDSVKTPSR